ncbi:MAG: class I tRNA ligase family protein, partial [Eggerthella lenta]
GYEPGEPAPSTPADRWIFSRLAGLVARLDAAFDGFEFGEATRELYAFFWNEFCDWYIEFSKARLGAGADPADRLACQRNLVFVLDQALRLLHPIMPFVTEEIYQELPIDREGAPYLIVAAWLMPMLARTWTRMPSVPSTWCARRYRPSAARAPATASRRRRSWPWP